MNINDLAKQHIKQITTNTTGGWGKELVLEAPNGQIATIAGLHTKIHLQYDPEGNRLNSKKAHVSFSEEALMAANPAYPLRNAAGQVHMPKHKVTVADSTGASVTYVVNEFYPDEVVGLIVCILGVIENDQ